MCCRNRCKCRDRNEVAGIQRIALRGPGCISGTGRCEGVLGTGGIRCSELYSAAEDFCERVFGDTGQGCCSNVLGTGGGRFQCSNSHLLGIRDREFRCGNSQVMGTGGGRCGQVMGTGGGFQCGNTLGAGCRCRRCRPLCCDLTTPITVPR